MGDAWKLLNLSDENGGWSTGIDETKVEVMETEDVGRNTTVEKQR